MILSLVLGFCWGLFFLNTWFQLLLYRARWFFFFCGDKLAMML